jgi:hypothetical protein
MYMPIYILRGKYINTTTTTVRFVAVVVSLSASPVSIHATHLVKHFFFVPLSSPTFSRDRGYQHGMWDNNKKRPPKKTHTKIREKKWSGFKLIFSTLVGQMVDFLIKKKQLLDVKYKMGTLRHADMSTASTACPLAKLV